MRIGRRISAVAMAAGVVLVTAAQAHAAPSLVPRFGPLQPPATQQGAPVLGSPTTSAPAVPSATAVRYRTIDVPGAVGTQVVTVTNSGVVGGNYYKDKGAKSFGFIEHGSTVTELNYPGTSGVTSLDGMNNSDVAVGTYVDAAGTDHGWIRAANGTFQALDDPLAATGDGFGTFPEGINHGVIVGFYVDAENLAHGFVYTRQSGFTTLDVPAAGTAPGAGTVLVSINSSGVITATYIDNSGVYHGAIDSHGTFFTFDAPGAGTAANQGTIPYGITTNDLVSGWTLNSTNEISGWLLSDYQFTAVNDPLEAIGPNLGSALYGIDASGTMAGGEYWDSSGTPHGYVATFSQ